MDCIAPDMAVEVRVLCKLKTDGVRREVSWVVVECTLALYMDSGHGRLGSLRCHDAMTRDVIGEW